MKPRVVREFKNKTIFFGAPTAVGFSEVIKEELERVGLTVYDFSPILDVPFKYKSMWQRLHNLYRKIVHNDYENKKKLRAKATEILLMRSLDRIPKADFSFFIRPDLFPQRFVEQVCYKSKLAVAYQWDGLRRYPEIYNYINHFDRFFVFDPIDLSNKTLPLTNFYIPSPTNELKKASFETAYFVGGYIDKKRFHKLGIIANTLQSLGIRLHFLVVCYDKRNLIAVKKQNFAKIEPHISYLSNLENVKDSSILVEVQARAHNGLSFRVFEALNYDKKLITTNHYIRDYDFYDPANIFIWDGKNSIDLQNFLNTPMRPISEKIKRKYSFDNWIKYVLDTGDYEAIELGQHLEEFSFAH